MIPCFLCIPFYPLSALVGYYLYQAAESIRETRIVQAELMTYIRYVWTKYEAQCRARSRPSPPPEPESEPHSPPQTDEPPQYVPDPVPDREPEPKLSDGSSGSDASSDVATDTTGVDSTSPCTEAEQQYAVVDIPKDTSTPTTTWGWF